jgi:hypothetical protein
LKDVLEPGFYGGPGGIMVDGGYTMKRMLILCALCLSISVGLASEGSPGVVGLSGGAGIGYTGLALVSESPGLALLNLRLGGFIQYSPFALGPGALGAELGAWLFYLPTPTGFFMGEFPVLAVYDIGLSKNSKVTIQGGYCLLAGAAEGASLIHGLDVGARFGFGHLFAEASLVFPLYSALDGETYEGVLFPHFEFGWRF